MGYKLALFDFDGTLTRRDSLADFIHYSVGLPRAAFGTLALSPILLAYKLGLYNNSKAKEKVISHFFKGWKTEKFRKKSQQYARERLPDILLESAQKKLMWHIEQNHTVVIVTASVEEWICEWTESIGVKLIATQLEKKKGIITGKYLTKNCNGKEKVYRIKNEFDLTQYETIFAYGDSESDIPMLRLAHQPFYQSFK